MEQLQYALRSEMAMFLSNASTRVSEVSIRLKYVRDV